MKGQNWYPAAAFSALLLSCGGSTDDGKGNPAATGGGTGIDSGVPTSTGGQPNYYYGPALIVGGSPAKASGGGTAQATGGFQGVNIYGPRFDKLPSSSISTGGYRASTAANAEGGAGESRKPSG